MGKGKKKDSETQPQDLAGNSYHEPIGKTPETAVLLLKSPEDSILIRACEATHGFAEKGDEDKLILLELGALEPLSELITHTNKLIKRYAFMALGSMVTNGDVKEALTKINVVPSLVDNLAPEEETIVHEFSTLCLASLSVDFVCKIQIFDKQGLTPLIRLLSNVDPDVQKNSVEVIWNLIQDYRCRVEVHKLGGIPPLLDLLHSEYPVIQHLALKVLQNITTDKDTRDTFREEMGFEKLMETLNNLELNDLHAEALTIVSNCLIDHESVRLIHRGGGLNKLLEFLLVPDAPEIQSNAVECIARVADISENRLLLHEQNVEKVLVELMASEDVAVKTSTCQAVATMSQLRASKERLRDLGVIPEIVEAMRSEHLKLKKLATLVIANVTHNNHLGIYAVFKAGGHHVLIQLLGESCPKTVASAASALGHMARENPVRNSILSLGVVQHLVKPLQSGDNDVLVNATLCLYLLACDIDARAEFWNAGGLQPLVNLLKSFHKQVLRTACLLVSVCASEESSAVEMCKYGALEILQDISNSVNRATRVSEMAMNSLLNSNLSVKYSLKGHLASTDVIRTPFYDAGKARPRERVLTIEEFAQMPVNQHRPIIVINTLSDQKNDTCSESAAKKPWKTDDIILQSLIRETKDSILLQDDEREQYAALARLVSGAMGGPVEKEKMHEFPWVLHISELKSKLKSNIIPIGMIKFGIYCHRAPLFKCLADSVGVSCTLVSGEYNRAWNEVFLIGEDSVSDSESSPPPKRYIVDLMHEPGNLLEVNTPAALKYQTI